jgi:hypothetical protein
MQNNHCLSCDRTDKDIPLLAVKYAGHDAWICPQCLPVLIHHSDQLADKLATIRQGPPKTSKA